MHVILAKHVESHAHIKYQNDGILALQILCVYDRNQVDCYIPIAHVHAKEWN